MSLSLLKPRVGSDMIADSREFAQKVHLFPPFWQMLMTIMIDQSLHNAYQRFVLAYFLCLLVSLKVLAQS